jgi:hypothetical protein
MPTIFDKRRTFHDLHKSGCFVIPNPWPSACQSSLKQT